MHFPMVNENYYANTPIEDLIAKSIEFVSGVKSIQELDASMVPECQDIEVYTLLQAVYHARHQAIIWKEFDEVTERLKCELTAPGMLERFLAAAEGSFGPLRQISARYILLWKLPDYQNIYKKLLRDDDQFVRASVCEYLGVIPIETLFEDLLDLALADEFWMVRSYAAKALQHCKTPEAVQVLLDVLEYDNERDDQYVTPEAASLSAAEALEKILGTEWIHEHLENGDITRRVGGPDLKSLKLDAINYLKRMRLDGDKHA
ncbi:MAG: HEAT repeat domain-containing protein [Planctomycetaceae bacterium]